MKWSKKYERFHPNEASSDSSTLKSTLSIQCQAPHRQLLSATSSQAMLNTTSISDAGKIGTQLHSITKWTVNHESAAESFAPSTDSFAGPFGICPTLLDLPTSLIDYWFSHVCPIWSTFDSDVNYKRQIATIYCTSSEVVSTVLQTMSAACIAWSTPSIRQHFGLLEARAGNAIVQRLSRIYTDPTSLRGEVITDLIFAILALGTSLHWARPSRHDKVLYMSARSLMDHWDANPDTENPLHLAFFRQALTYWEMLLSVSSHGTTNGNVERRLQRLQKCQLPASQQETESEILLRLDNRHAFSRGTRPNSSCGLSNEVVDLFAQVLALCRNVHERQKLELSEANSRASEATFDHAIARELHRELLSLDFDQVVHTDERLGFSLHTGDETTPLEHHIYVAEAYRLAGLLHLLISFPGSLDAETARLAGRSVSLQAESNSEWLATVSAQLIKTLDRIPCDSGIRCMLPVLYISAATGLSHPSVRSCILHNITSLPYTIDTSTMRHSQETGPPNVHGMRQTILNRLELLQRSLSPRPVATAIDLVKAIWIAHDAKGPGRHRFHWLEVIEDARFQTLFC